MKDYKILRDSMGEVKVPTAALYGAQTQRAVNNFPISNLRLPRRVIQALGEIKYCAAAVNKQLGKLEAGRAKAIQQAAAAVARGEYDEQFPVDVFQTGSGTSSNMNTNEVVATLANQQASKATALPVHPNDHVNMSQSSNDVFPTAIKVGAVLALKHELLPALAVLINVINQKGRGLSKVAKTGRTHLMDAMPLTMQQELSGWSAQLEGARAGLLDSMQRLSALPQGGTAVGTGVNANKQFGPLFAKQLSQRTKLKFSSMKNYFAGMAAQDAAVEASGQLRVLAVVIMKIANDLRWMNSGPLAGLGDIELPALQPGSSIMPGKVNPVIPESATMAAAQVMGNDLSVTICGQSGNFQLNVMMPLIAHNLLQSVSILATTCTNLANRAIKGFKVREDKLQHSLGRNPILVTALNQIIGYEKGAQIAKQAYKQGRPVAEVAQELTELSEQELHKLLDALRLTRGE